MDVSEASAAPAVLLPATGAGAGPPGAVRVLLALPVAALALLYRRLRAR